MLTIVSTRLETGEDTFNDVTTLHSPVYTLYCKDSADNTFEVETNKETYVQITNFLDKLRQV